MKRTLLRGSVAWKSFPQGEIAVKAQDGPCQPACLPCSCPSERERALSACIKGVALLISCKQAKSSLGEKHKAWQGRRDSFKTLLSFDNHSNKTSGRKIYT